MMGKLLPFMKFLEKEAGFRFAIEKLVYMLGDLIPQHLPMTITN
jgi:hypothetical protein